MRALLDQLRRDFWWVRQGQHPNGAKTHPYTAPFAWVLSAWLYRLRGQDAQWSGTTPTPEVAHQIVVEWTSIRFQFPLWVMEAEMAVWEWWGGWLRPRWHVIARTSAAHLKYLGYINQHKCSVYWMGRKLGVPAYIALLHDWHKFLPDEWLPYVRYFHMRPKTVTVSGTLNGQSHSETVMVPFPSWPQRRRVITAITVTADAPVSGAGYYHRPGLDEAFDLAWLKHQRRSKHHWQAWVLVYDSGPVKCLPMPEVYVREMVADWHAANTAQGGNGGSDLLSWYQANKAKIQLHPVTRRLVEALLDDVVCIVELGV